MPNDINTNTYAMTFIDRSIEKSTTQIGVQEFATNAEYDAARIAFETALIALTKGVLAQRIESLTTRLAPATTGAGERELKWLIRLTDTVTFEQFSFSIPCADVSAFTFQQNSDLIDLNEVNAAQVVEQIEAFYKTPRGNSATLSSIQMVGRNI